MDAGRVEGLLKETRGSLPARPTIRSTGTAGKTRRGVLQSRVERHRAHLRDDTGVGQRAHLLVTVRAPSTLDDAVVESYHNVAARAAEPRDRQSKVAFVLEEQQLRRREGQLERVQYRRILSQQSPHSGASSGRERSLQEHAGAVPAKDAAAAAAVAAAATEAGL